MTAARRALIALGLVTALGLAAAPSASAREINNDFGASYDGGFR